MLDLTGTLKVLKWTVASLAFFLYGTLLSAFSGMLGQGLLEVSMGRELTAVICACWRAGLIRTLSKRCLQPEDAIKHICNGGAISYLSLPLWSAPQLDLHSGSESSGLSFQSSLISVMIGNRETRTRWFLNGLLALIISRTVQPAKICMLVRQQRNGP